MTLAGFLAVAAAAQPPGIGQNGVINSASQIPPTLAGGAIARGALFTIRGVRLGSSEQTTKVTIDGEAAQLISVRGESVEAQMPRSTKLGSVSLVVIVKGQASAPFPVEVAASNPGIYSRNGEGWGPGRIQNIEPSGARVSNSTLNPAHPQQRIALLATGFGDVKQVRVAIGGRIVVAETPRPASRPGEYEVKVRIPADVPMGCYVPVYFPVLSARTSNVVTVSIRSGKGPCEAGAVSLLGESLVGVVALSRTKMKTNTPGPDVISDEAIVGFAEKGEQPVLAPLTLLPPIGTCTAYTSSFQATTPMTNSVSAALLSQLGGRGLDAGAALTLRGANGTRTISQNRDGPGYYRARLGDNVHKRRANPLLPFLDAGSYTLTGFGGRDAGPFSVTIPSPSSFEWMDRDQIEVIDRRSPLAVHWSGSASDRIMLVFGTNIGETSTAIGTCLCAAPAATGKFIVPAAILANLPASTKNSSLGNDRLFLVSIPAHATSFPAGPGIKGGAIVSMYAIGRIVEYR